MSHFDREAVVGEGLHLDLPLLQARADCMEVLVQ